MKNRSVFFLIFVFVLLLPYTIFAMDAENQQSVYVDDSSNGPNGARPVTEEHMREYLKQQEELNKIKIIDQDSTTLGPNGARPVTEEHMREYLEQQEETRKVAPPTGDSRLLIMLEHLWNGLVKYFC